MPNNDPIFIPLQIIARDGIKNYEKVLKDAQKRADAAGIKINFKTNIDKARSLDKISRSFDSTFGSKQKRKVLETVSAVNTYTEALKKPVTVTQELAQQTAVTAKRFTIYLTLNRVLNNLSQTFKGVLVDTVKFNTEITKLTQLFNRGIFDVPIESIFGLRNVISQTSASFGIDANKLTEAAKTFAQAGRSISETSAIIKSLGPATLTATFGDLVKISESLEAALGQFKLRASESKAVLDSFNSIAKNFNVTIDELFTGIKKAGGVFSSSSGIVDFDDKNIDKLREFLSVFTSIISTSRESADVVATSLRTILPRLQRGSTQRELAGFGINVIEDGQFVGVLEAIKRINDGLKDIDVNSSTFFQIAEAIGGLRQIGRTIPFLQQLDKAINALEKSQDSQNSVARDAALAQQDLGVQIKILIEDFRKLFREVGQTETFKTFANITIRLAKGLLDVADAIKEVIPLVAILGGAFVAVKTPQFLRTFFTQFGAPNATVSKNKGGSVPGFQKGGAVTARVTPGEIIVPPEEVKKKGVSYFNRANIGNVSNFSIPAGSKLVPGTGNTDSVLTQLEPGSYVIRKSSSKKIISSGKFAKGGKVLGFARGGISNIPRFVGGGETFAESLSIFAKEAKEIGASSKQIRKAYSDLARSGITDVTKATDFLAKRLESLGKTVQKVLPGGGTRSGRLNIPVPQSRVVERLEGGGVRSPESLNLPGTGRQSSAIGDVSNFRRVNRNQLERDRRVATENAEKIQRLEQIRQRSREQISFNRLFGRSESGRTPLSATLDSNKLSNAFEKIQGDFIKQAKVVGLSNDSMVELINKADETSGSLVQFRKNLNRVISLSRTDVSAREISGLSASRKDAFNQRVSSAVNNGLRSVGIQPDSANQRVFSKITRTLEKLEDKGIKLTGKTVGDVIRNEIRNVVSSIQPSSREVLNNSAALQRNIRNTIPFLADDIANTATGQKDRRLGGRFSNVLPNRINNFFSKINNTKLGKFQDALDGLSSKAIPKLGKVTNRLGSGLSKTASNIGSLGGLQIPIVLGGSLLAASENRAIASAGGGLIGGAVGAGAGTALSSAGLASVTVAGTAIGTPVLGLIAGTLTGLISVFRSKTKELENIRIQRDIQDVQQAKSLGSLGTGLERINTEIDDIFKGFDDKVFGLNFDSSFSRSLFASPSQLFGGNVSDLSEGDRQRAREGRSEAAERVSPIVSKASELLDKVVVEQVKSGGSLNRAFIDDQIRQVENLVPGILKGFAILSDEAVANPALLREESFVRNRGRSEIRKVLEESIERRKPQEPAPIDRELIDNLFRLNDAVLGVQRSFDVLSSRTDEASRKIEVGFSQIANQDIISSTNIINPFDKRGITSADVSEGLAEILDFFPELKRNSKFNEFGSLAITAAQLKSGEARSRLLSVAEQSDKGLGISLLDANEKAISDNFEEVRKIISRSLELSGAGGKSLQELLGTGTLGEELENVSKERFDKFLNVFSEFTNQLNEGRQRFIDNLNKINESILESRQLEVNVAARRFKAEDVLRNLTGQTLSINQAGQRQNRLSEILAPGSSTLSVSQIVENINKTRDRLNNEDLSLDERGELTLRVRELISSLNFNADQSRKLASIQKELADIEKTRGGAKALIRRLSSGDPRAAAEVQQGLQDIQRIFSGGQVFGSRFTQAIDLARTLVNTRTNEQLQNKFGLNKQQFLNRIQQAENVNALRFAQDPSDRNFLIGTGQNALLGNANPAERTARERQAKVIEDEASFLQGLLEVNQKAIDDQTERNIDIFDTFLNDLQAVFLDPAKRLSDLSNNLQQQKLELVGQIAVNVNGTEVFENLKTGIAQLVQSEVQRAAQQGIENYMNQDVDGGVPENFRGRRGIT